MFRTRAVPSSALVLLALALPLFAQDPKARLDANGDPLPEGAVARMGSVRFRTRSAPSVMRFSADGKSLATVGDDGTLHLWETATGKELRWFRREERRPPPSTPFDRFELLQLRAQIWIQEIDGGQGSAPRQVALAPDFRLVALWDGGTVQVWDTGTHKKLCEWQAMSERGWVPVAFSEDGKALATVRMEKEASQVVVVDPTTGKPGQVLKLPARMVPARLQFLAGNKELAGVVGQFVYVWDLKTGKRVRAYHADGSILDAAFSADGKSMVTGSNRGGVQLWDNASLDEQAKLRLEDMAVHAVAFAPDGKTVALVANDRTLKVWDPATGKATEVGTLDDLAGGLAYSPDGKTLALSFATGRIRLWDVAKGQEVKQDDDEIIGGGFIEGGKTILLLNGQGEALRHNSRTYKQEKRQPVRAKGTTLTAVSDDGRIVACALDHEAGVVLSRAEDAKELVKLSGLENLVNLMVFSPDGETLLTHETNTGLLRLWSVRTGQELYKLTPAQEHGPAIFSPNGRMIAAHITDEVWVWEAATGKRRCRIRVGDSRRVLAFTPDGRTLFQGGPDEVVRQWDVFTGKLVRGYLGHEGPVNYVHVSPDGKRLATGGDDMTVRLWDVTTGDELTVLKGHRGAVTGLEFAPDGKTLLSLGDDGVALVWDAAARPKRGEQDRPAFTSFDRAWEDLGQEDGDAAFLAIQHLTKHARGAVGFLAEKLKPVKATDPAAVAKLVADLDHAQFQKRVQAQKELEGLEGQAVAALKKGLAAKPSVEGEKRIKEILARAEQQTRGAELLRELRALETLEWIGTAEARELVEKLSQGAPGARLTTEAKATLERWK